MTTYEVRANDNPQAIPMGTSTVSTHSTAAEAFAALDEERRDFYTAPWNRDSYLPRLVVTVDENGEERVVPRPVVKRVRCIRCDEWHEATRVIDGETWCLRCSRFHAPEEYDMSKRITLAVRSEDGNHIEDRYVDEMSGQVLVTLIEEASEAGDQEAVAVCMAELQRRGVR